MSRLARLGVGIGLFSMLVGCGSVVTRLGPDSKAAMYPATSKTLDMTGDLYCWMFFACPIFLATLPVDFVLDTLLLPVDGIRVLNRDKPNEGTAQTASR